MKVLVTGSRGTLGSSIIKELEKKKVVYHAYSQTQELENVPWNTITHIINCAAVIPGPNESFETYWDGNVEFVSKLIKYSLDKSFIHFSSLSELYKFDNYQISKMVGSNLLNANAHIFNSLQIIPIPTLEDSSLVDMLIEKSKTACVTVDRLKYSYMEASEVASSVVKSITIGQKLNLISFYTAKDLYSEVQSKVSKEQLTEGKLIDRTSIIDGRVVATSHLKDEIIKKFKNA